MSYVGALVNQDKIEQRGPASTDGVVREYYSGNYGLRWALFVSTSIATMEVFHALPVVADCYNAVGKTLLVQPGAVLAIDVCEQVASCGDHCLFVCVCARARACVCVRACSGLQSTRWR